MEGENPYQAPQSLAEPDATAADAPLPRELYANREITIRALGVARMPCLVVWSFGAVSDPFLAAICCGNLALSVGLWLCLAWARRLYIAWCMVMVGIATIALGSQGSIAEMIPILRSVISIATIAVNLVLIRILASQTSRSVTGSYRHDLPWWPPRSSWPTLSTRMVLLIWAQLPVLLVETSVLVWIGKKWFGQ